MPRCNANGIADDAELNLKAIYVDGEYQGCENGTLAYPFTTVREAKDAATDGDALRIAAGAYAENVRIMTRLRLESRGGTVRIGW